MTLLWASHKAELGKNGGERGFETVFWLTSAALTKGDLM